MGTSRWIQASVVALMVGGLVGAPASEIAWAQTQAATPHMPTVTRIDGAPTLPLGDYDLAKVGYVEEEYFIAGTAQSYRFTTQPGNDGPWTTVADATAPYMTRIVVVRPKDPAKFSGTVIVDWLNVSGGADRASEWDFAHREMIRSGDIYVGASAQKVGIEGNGGLMGASLPNLKQSNPERYARLTHPGDAYAYDIFSQIGRVLKDRKTGPLATAGDRRVLATGESQSATFLVTYVNAIDPTARAYDGYLIHSRFGSGAPLTGVRGDNMPAAIKFRADLRVPVMTIITETDLMDRPDLKGYAAARQPDTAHLRTWEMAGTAHADRYAVSVSESDSGLLPIDQLVTAYGATKISGLNVEARINDGPQQHYIVQAAFHTLADWVKSGKAPPASPPRLEYADGNFRLGNNGMALGGVRSPWVDVPISRVSGVAPSATGFLALMGSFEHYDKQKLNQLYPGGKAEYLSKFTASLDDAIAKGFMLSGDRQENLDLAAGLYSSRQ